MKKTGQLMILMIVLTGCGKKTSCPPISEEYLSWLPYKMNENFHFTDGKDTIELSIIKTSASSEYTIKHSLIAEKICQADAYAKMTCKSIPLQIEFKAFYLPEIEPLDISYNIWFLTSEYSTFLFYFRNDSLDLPNAKAMILSSFSNGQKVYSNVLKLENDTTLVDQHIYQIYIAESVGIIQFTDRQNRKTWRLIGK
jgi:hypothetical protein